MIENALCDTIVGALDADVIVAGRGGHVVYANARAVKRLGDVAPDARLDTVFADWDEEMRAHLSRVAQSTQWVPVNLTPLGTGDGQSVRFRARGIREPESGEILLLLMAERHRDQGFDQLRSLIRDLNSELAERRRTQLKLEKALQSEERLHGELIHRVKNNLALLNALIHFRQSSTNNPDVKEALKDLEFRIHAILAVHDLLDRAGEIDFVQAGDLIRALCNQLEQSLLPDNIEIVNDLLDVTLSVKDATPLSLLVNELIINAVKHAFPDGRSGTVRVGLKKNGVDKLEVSIADDGEGFPDEETRRVGSGSRIVDALARQIGGTLERDVGKDGTHWSFIFPYDEESHSGSDARPTRH